MVLPIDSAWGGYEAYLAALDGKYRKSARQIAVDLDRDGVRVERVIDLEPFAERIHDLYLAVQENNRLRPVTAPASYLPALVRSFGDDARTTVVRRGEDLLGFVVTLRDGTTAVGYHIGFDREAAKTAPLYLRLLHAVVADAIDLRCARLSLGRTALEPKARLGAKPEPMEVWVKHRTGGVNYLLTRLLASVRHDVPPERNPFKKAKV